MIARKAAAQAEEVGWTFLTNHSHVLLCLEQDHEVRLRDVAQQVGITERAVQRIVTELEEEGYVRRIRQGRRNTYEIFADQPLRHPMESHRTVRSLLGLLRPEGGKRAGR
jgi:Mn-dependent DtxR family transcriptional regulator